MEIQIIYKYSNQNAPMHRALLFFVNKVYVYNTLMYLPFLLNIYTITGSDFMCHHCIYKDINTVNLQFGKENHFLPFDIKSLLTFMSSKFL